MLEGGSEKVIWKAKRNAVYRLRRKYGVIHEVISGVL